MKMKKELIGFCLVLIIFVVLFVVNREVKVDVKGTPIQVSGEISVKTLKVYISGEVLKPGVYELQKDDRLDKLVELAGGFTDNADTTGVNLAKILKDGEMVTIYPLGDQVTYVGIDIFNKGDKDLLESIDGIGQVLAERIIDYREKHGFFSTMEDLLNVDGIGNQKLKTIQAGLMD
ncbi:hypothetical protein EZV73_03840 [Acidaminobacter sp. JC074]|uniref:SLBB domain-containing protein n=1 Tax=Acidaminobacter sp. JC074 TaxID=2530199 RepID=UPI001F0E3CF4|nr:SLBB domain-containing protein [Acidaminobacter sp. JC074]MCH4886683.1 hypothetical protein [Acidaminobacter sp. JC074]